MLTRGRENREGKKRGEDGWGNRRCYESGAKNVNIFHNPTVDTGRIFLEVISLQVSQVHIGIASKLGQLSSVPSYVPLVPSALGSLTSQRPLARIARTSRRHIAPYCMSAYSAHLYSRSAEERVRPTEGDTLYPALLQRK